MSGCAAKLERTGFVLRNVWPGVKHFGIEQSTNFAQSANESGFVRKNSRKVEAAASAGSSHCPRPSSVLPRGARAAAAHPPRLRVASRRLAPESLGGAALRPRARQISVGSCAEPKPLQPSVAALLPERLPEQPLVPEAPVVREEPKSKGGVSIEDLVRTASEKYELNRDFWGKYEDIPSMAQAADKHDILQIIENFVLIHRKHVYLFQRLKNTVLKSLDHWSAPDLAALCHAWVQLGFLHEDLCVAMAGRVTATAHACNAQELCWLMDAYASARCSVHSALEELTKQTLRKLEDFTLTQLCLHASSFARLNLPHPLLFDCIAERLAALPPPRAAEPLLEEELDTNEEVLSARDLTLAAYSFAKLGFHNPRVFQAISRGALSVIRDFTARDLQMLMVALARARHRDAELLSALAWQANRRVAQFSSESLALTLRSLAFFHLHDNPLFTRAVAQLPRTILHSRPSDVTTLLNAFAAVQIHSVALIDIVTPFIMEKAPFFTPADWLGALRGYSALGCRDAAFLSTLRLHLTASKLTLSQLCAAMVDCSRLSFSGLSAALAEAAAAKVAPEGFPLPADAAAQMYSALLLLGHSTAADLDGECVHGLLAELSAQLRGREAAGQLSPTACANLCYATLLAPPAKNAASARHPLDASDLLERCVAEAQSLSLEDRLVLRLVSQALNLLPWNRRALESARRLEPLTSASSAACSGQPPAAYLLSALAHLAPCANLWPWLGRDPPPRATAVAAAAVQPPLDGPADVASCGAADVGSLQGIFLAREIQDALEDISSVLSEQQIQHDVVLDLNTEAHIAIPRAALPAFGGAGPPLGPGPARRELAVLWGSTVHYVRGAEDEGEAKVEPRLSPAARFQVSLLQELRNMDVVVVPHWRWPRSGLREERARALAGLVREPGGC